MPRHIPKAIIPGPALAAAFWPHVQVNKQSCWLWTAGASRAGYGLLHHRGVILYAHRISWTLANGPIQEGLLVCHTCDTPRCVRPDHLFLGTQADNVADAKRKGRTANRCPPERMPRGEAHWHTKLTDSQISHIRARLADGARQHDLAREYDINQSHVSRIATNKVRHRQ